MLAVFVLFEIKTIAVNDAVNKNSSVTVKAILAFCWFYYAKTHNIRDVEASEVKKALDCYGHKNGCFVYSCLDCGQVIFQSLGCNARICSCCGKRYADSWAVSLSKKMFRVPHRHIVLSVASELWPYLKGNWSLLKVYQDSAIDALNQYLPSVMNDDVECGVIVVLHTFGKDMQFKPHLHLIMTEGGFNSQNEFIQRIYLHAPAFAEVWKYHVCKNLSRNGIPFSVTDWCFKNKRFYVWVHKDGRINHPKVIAKYLGRYVRHPVIANSRIDFFNQEKYLVGFHYDDHQKMRHNIVMSTDEFITALIGHIPPPNFKMIRYYGAYARRSKRRFKKHLQSSIEQMKLMQFGVETPKKRLKCPYCAGRLEFVIYNKKPPPEIPKIQRELLQWH